MSKITFKFVLGSLDQLTVDTPNDDADLEPPNPFAKKPGKTKKKSSIKKKPAGRGTGSGNAAGSSRRGPDGRGKEADAFTHKDDNDDAAFTPKDLQAQQYDAAKTFAMFGMPHKRSRRAPEAVSASTVARVRRELDDNFVNDISGKVPPNSVSLVVRDRAHHVTRRLGSRNFPLAGAGNDIAASASSAKRASQDSIDMVKVPGVSTKPGDEQREDTASTLSV